MSLIPLRSPVAGARIYSPYQKHENFGLQRKEFCAAIGLIGFSWRTTAAGIGYFTGTHWNSLFVTTAFWLGANFQLLASVLLMLDGHTSLGMVFSIFAFFWHLQWMNDSLPKVLNIGVVDGDNLTADDKQNNAFTSIFIWVIFIAAFVAVGWPNYKSAMIIPVSLFFVTIAQLLMAIDTLVDYDGAVYQDIAHGLLILGGVIAIYGLGFTVINFELGKTLLPGGYAHRSIRRGEIIKTLNQDSQSSNRKSTDSSSSDSD